jgi:hypothetical protein
MTSARSRRAREVAERAAQPPVRSGPGSGAIIRLQRTLGNRGTRALLRSPRETDPQFAALTTVGSKGGLDAAAWKEKVVAAKQALREHKLEDATALYIELYQDLARTAGAEAIPDVGSGYPINVAAADDTGYKPGLNLVLGSGGSRGGSTAYIDAAGKFGARLSLSGGASQGIAIRLFGGSFSEDKALTLDILRHEMTHAKHLTAARESAAKWAKAGGTGGSDKFVAWLKRNRKGLSDADVAIFEETARGGTANSEVLAYVEGFMTVFHLIDPPPPIDHPIYMELLGVLETTKVLPWRSADKGVRDLAVARLERYYSESLDGDHRAAFNAWVQAQAKRAADDEAALKAHSNAAAVASARARQENAFADFIKRLQAVMAKSSAKSTAKAGRPTAKAGR